MKHRISILILCLLGLGVLPVSAQLKRFSISEFSQAPQDLTARNALYSEEDDNGSLYAIIKVKSSQTDDDLQSYRFDFGLMSSFVKPHPDTREVWVYVQKNAKTVTISRKGFVSVSKYDLGQSLRAGTTYTMLLDVAAAGAPAQAKQKGSILSVNSRPTGAAITVDGKDYGQTPNKIFGLAAGEHQLTLNVQGYKEYTLTCNIEEDQTTSVDVELEGRFKIVGDDRIFTVEGHGKKVEFTMKKVEAGTFTMHNYFHPASTETIEKDYYIGETEVTQALWWAVMGSMPTHRFAEPWTKKAGLGDNYPAYGMDIEEARKFCKRLSQMTEISFRLPTDAEWEYAARGGNRSKGYKYSGSNLLKDFWSSENSGGHAHEVKGLKPNELGLYDMSGNVREGTESYWLRGGSWSGGTAYCEIAGYCSPLGFDYRGWEDGGFRIVHEGAITHGALVVTSVQPGVNIKIDGKDYGQAPKEIPGLLVGVHDVELSANGGKLVETLEVKVTEDDPAQVCMVTLCPDDKHPHMVDMGTGTKWACCNVGAKTPASPGAPFAWGETATKKDKDFTQENYKWFGRNASSIKKYCTNQSHGQVDNKTVLEPVDDAATANWGREWRTPTVAEVDALREKATWSPCTLNGREGFQVTGPNGNSIFFHGYSEDSPRSVYMTSSLSPNSGKSFFMYNDGLKVSQSQHREDDFLVRPVSAK